jgi:hypothetical protein
MLVVGALEEEEAFSAGVGVAAGVETSGFLLVTEV